MASEVVDLFTELAAISSPPGEERPVADAVLRYLQDIGLTVDEDGAGIAVGSNMGNLYCRVEPSGNGGGTPIFLCAHLDTVPPEGPLEPVVEHGVVRNAGGTILGADDKSAVAAMLEGTRRVLAENRPHAGIELLFTPKEEVGLLGAAAFDHDRLHAELGYVYDQASAIADLRLGRIDEETTANVGVISGGTAGNIVPEWCTFRAEARCHDERRLNELVQEMVDACSFAATATECEVETELRKSYNGYRFKRDEPVVQLAAQALTSC